jgi:hypothetical protein
MIKRRLRGVKLELSIMNYVLWLNNHKKVIYMITNLFIYYNFPINRYK